MPQPLLVIFAYREKVASEALLFCCSVCIPLHAGAEKAAAWADSQMGALEGCASTVCPTWLAWLPGQRQAFAQGG